MAVPNFSPVLSGCLGILLVWAVVCPVNGEGTVQPITTAGYSSKEETYTYVAGNITQPSVVPDCAKSELCWFYCEICDGHFSTRMDCLTALLHHVCLDKFNNAMGSLNSSDWCVWNNVNRMYSNLSICTEQLSDCLLIPWPNPLVEQNFVDIHSTYFQECPTEEFTDPPPAVVFALVITPICLIPVMVSLVVLKTKSGDGNA